MAVLSFRKNIFVCGGFDDQKALNDVEKYSVETNSWTILNPMKKARYFCTITQLEEYLYAIGGVNNGEMVLKVCHLII